MEDAPRTKTRASLCFCKDCDGKKRLRKRDRVKHGCPLTCGDINFPDTRESEAPARVNPDFIFDDDYDFFQDQLDSDPGNGSGTEEGASDTDSESGIDEVLAIGRDHRPVILQDEDDRVAQFTREMRIWVIQHLDRHSRHYESWKSFDELLAIDARMFKKHLPLEVSELIPNTKYLALKSVTPLLDPIQEVHACVKDHYIFEHPNIEVCQVQGCEERRFKATKGGTAPRRVMYHWSLARRLEKMWGSKKIAEFMHWSFLQSRDRGDDMKDFMDGRAFKEIMNPRFGDSVHNVAGIFCCDGVEARKRGACKSIVPIVIKFLNLPPWLQTKAGLMFIWGFPPPSCKMPIYLRYFAEKCHELAMFGLHCWDAHQQRACVTRFFLMLSTNDLKAKVKVVHGADVGSIKHCCSHCDIEGIYVAGLSKTIYPSAICHLPALHETKLAMLKCLGVNLKEYKRQHSAGYTTIPLIFFFFFFPTYRYGYSFCQPLMHVRCTIGLRRDSEEEEEEKSDDPSEDGDDMNEHSGISSIYIFTFFFFYFTFVNVKIKL